NPDGLDVEAVLRSRNRLGEVDRSALQTRDRRLPREDWLDIECDILVPAALADVINADNAARVRARLVVEAANIPTTEEAQRALHTRGVVVIPDYVANGGANAGRGWTLLGEIGTTAAAACARCKKIMHRAGGDARAVAGDQGIAPREAADQISLRSLDRLVEELGEEASQAPAAVS